MENLEFGFKDLRVWQKSILFADEILKIVESLNSNSKHYRLIEQIEADCVSIPSNIAEG